MLAQHPRPCRPVRYGVGEEPGQTPRICTKHTHRTRLLASAKATRFFALARVPAARAYSRACASRAGVLVAVAAEHRASNYRPCPLELACRTLAKSSGSGNIVEQKDQFKGA